MYVLQLTRRQESKRSCSTGFSVCFIPNRRPNHAKIKDDNLPLVTLFLVSEWVSHCTDSKFIIVPSSLKTTTTTTTKTKTNKQNCKFKICGLATPSIIYHSNLPRVLFVTVQNNNSSACLPDPFQLFTNFEFEGVYDGLKVFVCYNQPTSFVCFILQS